MNYIEETKKYEEAFLQDLKDMIKIASLRNDLEASENAPFGKGCREALDQMLAIAKRDGFKVKDYQGYAGVIEYGEGEESVGILGHLDIVPIGVGWSKDPFGCEIHDGYVFGRGVLDDKGPTLCAYYALKMIKDANIKLNKKIMLIMGCDEESGMECMNYYTKHGEIPTCGFTPDADFPLIYGEKGILDFCIKGKRNTIIKAMHAGERPNIVIGKASVILPSLSAEQEKMYHFYLDTHMTTGEVIRHENDVELVMDGIFQHSAYSYGGMNAALHLLNFVGKTFDDKLANELYDLCHDWKGTGLNIDINGAYMGFLTMNAGIVTIEDGEVDVLIDVRYPNDVSGAEIIEKARKKIAQKNADLTIEVVEDLKPLFVDPKSKLIETLEKSYRKYTNDQFTPIQTIGGGTYARKFNNFVAFGPEFPQKEETPFFVGGPHEKDEGMKIEELMKAMAIYADAIENLGQ
ncbi:MAG: dipeptidase PepV [Erysipelotrichia bacterium]|nr:dipeptidase PepV [Erysipelotrichia bacterium]